MRDPCWRQIESSFNFESAPFSREVQAKLMCVWKPTVFEVQEGDALDNVVKCTKKKNFLSTLLSCKHTLNHSQRYLLQRIKNVNNFNALLISRINTLNRQPKKENNSSLCFLFERRKALDLNLLSPLTITVRDYFSRGKDSN